MRKVITGLAIAMLATGAWAQGSGGGSGASGSSVVSATLTHEHQSTVDAPSSSAH